MGRKKSAQELKQISKREMDVIKLIVEDLINKEIGALLGISEQTVKTHKQNIRRKLRVKGDVGIAFWWRDNWDPIHADGLWLRMRSLQRVIESLIPIPQI